MSNRMKQLGFAATILIVLLLSFNMLREPFRQRDTLTDKEQAAVDRGADLYAQYCVECHGDFGEGLNQNPTLNSAAVRNMDADDIYKTIARGRLNTAMVAFLSDEGGIFTSTQIDDLVTMIKLGSWRDVQQIIAAQGLTPTEVPPIEQQFNIDALSYPLEIVSAGREVYLANCFSCHNTSATGATGHSIGKDLTDNEFVQENTDEELLAFVIEGRTADDPVNITGNAMPPRADNPNLTDEEILQSVAYVRELNSGAAQLIVDTGEDTPPTGVYDGIEYQWVEVIGNFDSPVLVTHAGDGSGRLFVVEQPGRIMIVADGAMRPDPFLDITALVPRFTYSGGYTELGLLGVAFHPDYENNGLFFISYNDLQGDSVIARYSVMPDDPHRADPNSQVVLLTQDQPFEDHNGGNIIFGPDGYLYIAFGDGGRPAEPNYNSQKPDTYLGKMLRIDVSTDVSNPELYTIPPDNPFLADPSFLPEIWALGLRNPWRFTFDRVTGDMFVGDVGQWLYEELDYQPGTSPGGENYGWSAFEGWHTYLEDETVRGGDYTPPILEYGHDVGNSITGGYVYRGESMPGLWGKYIYADYVVGKIWVLYRDDMGDWQNDLLMDSSFVVSSFGEDESGELYLVDYKGPIYRLEEIGPVPEPTPEPTIEPETETATETSESGE
ncbi:MAG: PQQ-dependent sugar dehydrogenase [Anaerolineae bacterium]|nr:PQQ-dependent sugar dehydrogenase [Anaerolineae bacterium]